MFSTGIQHSNFIVLKQNTILSDKTPLLYLQKSWQDFQYENYENPGNDMQYEKNFSGIECSAKLNNYFSYMQLLTITKLHGLMVNALFIYCFRIRHFYFIITFFQFAFYVALLLQKFKKNFLSNIYSIGRRGKSNSVGCMDCGHQTIQVLHYLQLH